MNIDFSIYQAFLILFYFLFNFPLSNFSKFLCSSRPHILIAYLLLVSFGKFIEEFKTNKYHQKISSNELEGKRHSIIVCLISAHHGLSSPPNPNSSRRLTRFFCSKIRCMIFLNDWYTFINFFFLAQQKIYMNRYYSILHFF